MNILSLQGGGCLGYGQVLILEALEETNGQASSSMFGLIAGTSVGSIIGACLAIGIPATNIKSFFTIDAPNIFSTNWINNIKAVFSPKYNSSVLASSLQSVLGTNTLKDCKTPFIATSYDWTSDKPVYFKSYELSSENDDFIVIGYDSPICLWQICTASAAAQTYFPAFIYNNLTLLDGGNTGDNVPDLLAIAEVIDNNPIKTIQMLSLGSGNTTWKEASNAMINPSLLTAGLKTITLLFSAGEDARVYAAQKILKSNYYRLTPDLGNGIAIDNANGCISEIPIPANIVIKNSVNTVFPQFKV